MRAHGPCRSDSHALHECTATVVQQETRRSGELAVSTQAAEASRRERRDASEARTLGSRGTREATAKHGILDRLRSRSGVRFASRRARREEMPVASYRDSGSASLRLRRRMQRLTINAPHSPQKGSSVSSDVMFRRFSVGRRMRNPRTSTLCPLRGPGLYAADTSRRYVLGPSGHASAASLFARSRLWITGADRIGRMRQHPRAVRSVRRQTSDHPHERKVGHRLRSIFSDELNLRQILNAQLLGAGWEFVHLQQIADDVDIGLVAERTPARREASSSWFCRRGDEGSIHGTSP